MLRRYALRRGFAAVLFAALALLTLGAPGPAARAEGENALLRIQVTARPEALIEPGEVMLSFTVENVSEEDARNVYLSSADGLTSELVGQLAPGETQSFNRQHSVTEAELEAGEILYTISHDDPVDADVKVNYSVRAQIRRGDAQPAVEFTRQLSGRSVEAGGALTIAYRLRNVGNVPLTDLQVQDALGSYVGRVDALEVGESRTLINRATLAAASASSATLSYRAAGDGEVRVETLEDVRVDVAGAQIGSAFTADYSAFSRTTANVVLVLTNGGGAGYRDICVMDDVYGGVIADELTLPAGGDPLEISRAYAVRGEQGYRWRVTGASESGERIDFVTETLRLPPQEEAPAGGLRLSVRALTPRIRRPGNVTMRVSIENPGGAELRDLTLSEASLGDLYTFAVLPSDGAIERDFAVRVESDGSYGFSIAGTDGSGGAASASAAPVEVVIASDGVLPEGERERLIEFTGGSIKIGGSTTFAALLIAGCALLLILIVALAIVTYRTRQARRDREMAERRRLREELGKTNRFTPVRVPRKGGGKGRNL